MGDSLDFEKTKVKDRKETRTKIWKLQSVALYDELIVYNTRVSVFQKNNRA